MSDSGDLTDEEFATWLTPNEARARVGHHVGDLALAARAIITRLKAALIQSAATSVSFGSKVAKVGLVGIKPAAWDTTDVYFAHNEFWRSGDVTFEIWNPNHADHESVTFYGVRIDPEGIAGLVPKPAVVTPLATPDPEDSKDSAPKPPVADAALQAWFVAYAKAYGPDQPEGHAVSSAKGMFPDKAVSRERVRALLKADGPRKRGKKTT